MVAEDRSRASGGSAVSNGPSGVFMGRVTLDVSAFGPDPSASTRSREWGESSVKM